MGRDSSRDRRDRPHRSKRYKSDDEESPRKRKRSYEKDRRRDDRDHRRRDRDHKHSKNDNYDPLKNEEKKETLDDYIDFLNKQHDEQNNKLKGIKPGESKFLSGKIIDAEEVKKEEPNFTPSGILAEETNKVNGVVLKFTEPLNARDPDRKWRFYCFKGDEGLPPLHIHRQSVYLVGKDIRV